MHQIRWASLGENLVVIVALAVVANAVSRATGWPLLYVLIAVVWGGGAVYWAVRSRFPRGADASVRHSGERDGGGAERG